MLKKYNHIPHQPNFLNIFPLSHEKTRLELGDTELTYTIPELKKVAIRKSFELAIQKYGYNPMHRFGMSDDDPNNIELITQEMLELKKEYPKISFFVIQTFKNHVEKKRNPSQKTQKNR